MRLILSILLLGLVACGGSSVLGGDAPDGGPADAADAADAFPALGCASSVTFGTFIPIIEPPAQVEVCLNGRCGNATLDDDASRGEPAVLEGAFPATVKLDGLRVSLLVNVAGSVPLADGDQWRLTITDRARTISGTGTATYVAGSATAECPNLRSTSIAIATVH